MAPPKHEHRLPSSAFLTTSDKEGDDDLSRHDDGSLILLDSYEDDDSIDEPWLNDHLTDRPEFVIDAKLLNYVNNGDDDVKDEHNLELSQLSRDVNEFLYNIEDTKDDDEDLLTYYLRKRDLGFKEMAKSYSFQAEDRLNTYDIYLRQREQGFKEMAKAQSDKAQAAEAVPNLDGLHNETSILPENSQVDETNKKDKVDKSDDVEGNEDQDDQFPQGNDYSTDEEGEKKFNIYSHRPKQNRTGTEWGGWHHAAHSNLDQVGADADHKKYWWRNSKQCFEVDSICHTRSTNSWFYYEPKQQSTEQMHELFQPSMELRCEPLRYDRGLIAEERVNITVEASSKLKNIIFINNHTFQLSPSSSTTINDMCKISPVPTHMALQAMFNFMIGEFYARTLLPLYRLMTSISYDNETQKPWEEDIQFYVHTAHGNQVLYDGHKLLLSGMLAKENAADVKSIVDLFSVDEESSSLEQDCECFEKMVFCGYDVRVEDVSTEAATSNLSDHNTVDVTPDADSMYTLWGASTTADDLETTGFCGKSQIEKDLYSCDDWAELRQFLLSNFAKHYPSLQSDVVTFRKSALLKLGFVEDKYNGNTKEWKFIGLAQRSYRRSWINLPEIIDECNKLHYTENENVVCIEVNVEKTKTPYEQLILHQSVDALIGVHGAQLTQAVLLPPHAHLLELLPWVTDYIRGEQIFNSTQTEIYYETQRIHYLSFLMTTAANWAHYNCWQVHGSKLDTHLHPLESFFTIQI